MLSNIRSFHLKKPAISFRFRDGTHKIYLVGLPPMGGCLAVVRTLNIKHFINKRIGKTGGELGASLI